MKKTIKWGILGPGKIARKFAQDLLLHPEAEIYAVASRDSERAANFAAEFNVSRKYVSYQELVQDPEVDIIYIATPHVFHYEQAQLCLNAGKNILCEKPFGMNAREVTAISELAGNKGLFAMEGIWTRFIPGTEKVLEIINSGAIGEILNIKADFGFLGNENTTRRVYDISLGAGSLLDIGIYPVYLSLLLQGIPKTINAMASFAAGGADIWCGILFDFENGSKAILESTMLANTEIEAVIYGSRATLIMHHRFHHTKQITVNYHNGTQETFNIGYSGNGYYHEIQEVMHCLKNGQTESQKVPLEMSLKLAATLDKIREIIGLKYDADLQHQK